MQALWLKNKYGCLRNIVLFIDTQAQKAADAKKNSKRTMRDSIEKSTHITESLNSQQ